MKYKLIILLAFLSLSATAQKKPHLIHRGKITWERKMNQHSYLDEMAKNGNKAFLDQAKKRADKYKVDKFVMDFNRQESIYKPAVDGISESQLRWGAPPAQENEVYNSYKTNSTVAKKEVYDKNILIKDSLKKFKWKLKEEFRTIAGFSCRRAETIIMDSVWVVAFYTDAIIAPGGPESFNGLPGMILGVVMPRLNLTYFASDVQVYADARRKVEPPKKGKEFTNKGFIEYLNSNMKQWGNYLQRVMWYSGI